MKSFLLSAVVAASLVLGGSQSSVPPAAAVYAQAAPPAAAVTAQRSAPTPIAQATAIIEGPATIDPGDLLILDAGKSDAVSFAWRVYPAKTILPIEKGTKVVAAFGQPGEYRFILATAKGDVVAIAEHVVIVGVPAPPTPPVPPGPPTPPVVVPSPVSACTFVYEKDQSPVPAGVLAALNKLNRERGIIATIFEDDTTDGTGEVPEQYRAAVAAAKEAGLPVLVVLAGKTVLKVVKDPKTEAAVMEAVGP